MLYHHLLDQIHFCDKRGWQYIVREICVLATYMIFENLMVIKDKADYRGVIDW